MNHHSNSGAHSWKLKFLEFPHFDWGIGQRIVIRKLRRKRMGPVHSFIRLNSGTFPVPEIRDVAKYKLHLLRATLWHVHQNHRGIDEGVLAVQLRSKGTGLVPVRGITDDEGSVSSEAPGLLVDFFDGRRRDIGCDVRPRLSRPLANFHLLDVRNEGTNLHNT